MNVAMVIAVLVPPCALRSRHRTRALVMLLVFLGHTRRWPRRAEGCVVRLYLMHNCRNIARGLALARRP